MDLELIQWLVIVATGVMIGLAKTGIPALGILVVTLMATVFPARESIGIVLPILIVGDIVAVTYYRRSVDWPILTRLIPWVSGGLILGFILLFTVTESRPIEIGIGLIVIGMILLQSFKGLQRNTQGTKPLWFVIGMGTLGGFTTMIGNAAGPVMTLFFLSYGLSKLQFVGTGAWFFLTVNLIKVPLFMYLGLITLHTLTINALMIPMILAGTWLGIRLLPWIPQALFNRIVLILSFIGAVMLLV
ncbi:sulfite exporter TauE/SafE family protein [Salisediminibacterium selenitireducens]|uniref:Probable membrane transporter protein n=1 Tax=Bacillus selenitireducens (strain ATCC 700615 / DSM 15326 / MLS10) TaxID=439292 RepID=D6XXC5_BACIE|nr:sulfite exporter TauE/SafE family protein [Salisediminibacterium selenitireducens]ADH97982.1 protein of unknown function DUF81 [[Bacillus] selenitireducens MLS10]